MSTIFQVTVQYVQKSGTVVPQRVHTVVISAQHDDGVSLEEQKKVLKEQVIKAVVPSKYLDESTIYHLQPSGRFVIGGPQVKVLAWPQRRHCLPCFKSRIFVTARATLE